MGKKRINSQTLDLPDEIIGEILIKFPVKFLLTLKCVSKSWCRVISSKEFIREHLKNWSTSTELAHHKVILCCSNQNIKWFKRKSKACSLKSLLDESAEGLVIENLDQHPMTNWSFNNLCVKILGSCNGLVLLSLIVNWTSPVLWNPSTRESKKIPSPPFAIDRGYRWEHFKYGFAYDDTTDDYKIVCISSIRRPFLTQIYSWRTNSWREIENFPKVLPGKHSAQLVNRRLHFLAEEGGVWDIVSLSLLDDKYEVMPWPENILVRHDSRRTLGNLGGYLSLVTDDGFGDAMYVWIMKKYGEAKSWTKIWSLSDFDIPLYSCPKPLWLMKNGDIAVTFGLASGSVVAVYDVENKACKSRVDIVSSKILFEPNIYVESLVSPSGNEQSHQ